MSKKLRKALIEVVDRFAENNGINLDKQRQDALGSILGNASDEIAASTESPFTAPQLQQLRDLMLVAIQTDELKTDLKPDSTERAVIKARIDNFAAKTNQGMLTEALEFEGLTLSPDEKEVLLKRNDCLHVKGRSSNLTIYSMSE